jgi:oligopeptide transport system permease protein
VTALAARRLARLVLTLVAIALASFALLRAAPGGPFDDERSVPPAVLAALEERFGLSLPAFWNAGAARARGPLAAVEETQIGRYFGGLLRGDLGPSFKYRGRSVNEVLAAGAPASAAVGLLALEVAVILGLGLGALAATRRGGLADRAVGGFAALAGAVPNYVFAVLFASTFCLAFRIFPIAGFGRPAHLVLPALALALPHAAAIARLARASLLETLGQDFVRTARAKGISEAAVVLRHALRPALAPVVQYLGPATAALATGSLAVEAVFNIPGMGAHFVNAAQNRDYTLVMGTVLVYSAALLVFNALADLAAAWLDPRAEALRRA